MLIRPQSSYITIFELIIIRKKLTELPIFFFAFFQVRIKKITFKLKIIKFFIVCNFWRLTLVYQI